MSNIIDAIWVIGFNELSVRSRHIFLGAFADIALNHNGVLMATCCLNDRTVKIFDV